MSKALEPVHHASQARYKGYDGNALMTQSD
jgi:hypothetical protein